MDDDELNESFFDALRQVIGLSTTTYDNHKDIWAYEIPWPPKWVTRPGYLYFGLPNQRSTAQPERDFSTCPFTPPFGAARPAAEPRTDEVLLALRRLDAPFNEALRLYGGARALAKESAAYRDTYQDKATGRNGYLSRLTAWLRDHQIQPTIWR